MKQLLTYGLVLVLSAMAIVGSVFASEVGAACNTALLIIDVQRMFLQTGTWQTTAAENVVDAIAGILPLARESGIPIIYIQDTTGAAAWTSAAGFPTEIEPQEGDRVFEKQNAHSAFSNPEFKDALTALGIERLIFAGIASGACVNGTLQSARMYRYEILVIADAHSGGHGGRVAEMQNAFWAAQGCAVVPSDEVDFATLCSGTTETHRESEGEG